MTPPVPPARGAPAGEGRELPPCRGAIALCSLGLVGRITSDAPHEITYADGKTGVAWTGVQVTAATFVSPFTGETVRVRAGDPWSSRTPVVLGYGEDVVAGLHAAIRRRDVAAFRDFIASYANEWGDGEWGWETALLRRILAALPAPTPSGA